MLPPINKSKSQIGRITRTSKTPKNTIKKQVASASVSNIESKPLKGQIRQLVFTTLKRKFGEKAASEPDFIKMVDSICARLEPSIHNSHSLQEQLKELLK